MFEFHNITEKFREALMEWQHRRFNLEERIMLENSRIKHVCEKYYIEASSMARNRPAFENVENFYADIDRNLGWCVIPKVNFLELV